MTPELEIREIEKTDKDEVVEMTSGIWDGRDYIPDYFDRWVEDGGFICGTVDGEIVALAKHTWHSEDVLWLEGLRVHPDHREKGYGRAMIEGQLDYINDNLDYQASRFLTSNDNTVVKKVVEDLGFKLKKAYDYVRLDDEDIEEMEPPSDEEIKEVQVEDEVEEVTGMVLSSEELDDNEGLYMEHWTAYPMDEDLIKDRVKNGYCYAVRDEDTGEIDALMFMQVHDIYGSLSVCFACGSQEGMEELFKFGLKHCLEEGYDRLRLKSASEKVINAAKEVGLSHSDHHNCTLVYEYKAD
ncbi:MAG: GNAT family N-acetyltransferase [Candidatus Natronoplasma sp.]